MRIASHELDAGVEDCAMDTVGAFGNLDGGILANMLRGAESRRCDDGVPVDLDLAADAGGSVTDLVTLGFLE